MGKGGGSQTIGYKYYLGLHAVLCKTLDRFHEVRVDGKVLWNFTFTGSGAMSIEWPDFFGDEKREGGVSGQITIYDGAADQGVPAYLHAQQEAPVPAYRGVVSMVWEQIYYGNSPIPRPWKCKVSRTTPDDGFRPDLAEIGAGEWVDMNPAHILREVIALNARGTEPEFGTTWEAVAQTLYDENLGLSFVRRGDGSLDAFKQDLERHINGVVYVDRSTGLIECKLFRDDYVIADLQTFGDDEVIDWVDITWPDPREAPNQITLIYTARAKEGENGSVTVTNTARVSQIGHVKRERLTMRGITRRGLAGRIATRELQAMGSAPMQGAMRVAGLDPTLNIGAPIIISAPRLGVAGIVVRITAIEESDSRSFDAIVRFAEDRFAFGEEIEIGEDIVFDDATEAQPASPRRVEEMPYYTAVVGFGIDAGQIEAQPEDGLLSILAGQPTGLHRDYQIQTDDGGGYGGSATGDFSEHTTLVADIARMQTSVEVATTVALADVSVGDLALIGDEIVRVDAITGTTMTVGRGCLDTVPQAHVAGTAVWLPQGVETDGVDYGTGETVAVKLLTRTASDVLTLAEAPADEVTFAQRAARPYPPGQLQVDGSYDPGTAQQPTVVTWAHRDRLTQTGATVEDHTAGDIGPEAGVTYRVEVEAYQETGESLGVVTTADVGSDTTWSMVDYSGVPAGAAELAFRVVSLRDGLESWQVPDVRAVPPAYVDDAVLTADGADYELTHDSQPVQVA